MNRLKINVGMAIATLLAVASFGGASAQTVTVHPGTSGCTGSAALAIPPGGGTASFHVCVNAASPATKTCGLGYRITASSSVGMTVTRTLGTAYPDPTIANATFNNGTNNLLAPTSAAAGSTVADGVTPVAAANGIVAASYTLTVPGSVAAGSYTVGPSSTLLNITGTTCDDINVGGASDFSPAATTPLTVTVAATPATAVFTISTPVNVTEGGATANAVVTCTGALDGSNTPITVPFTTTNAAGNFTTNASPVTFTACAGATQNIVVSPRVDDAIVQGAVSGTIVLGTPSAGSLGATTTATVNVADNDTPPVFGLVKAGACAEPTTSCTFGIVRESGVTNTSTVGFTITGTATRGTDYTLNDTVCGGPVIAGNSVSHTQAAPSGTFTIAVCPIDDTAVEGAETVIMTLNTGAGYTLGAVATQTQSIADDDSPQVVTVAVNGPVSEAGGVLTYTFTRSGGSAAAQAATLSVNTTAPATSSRYSTTCGASITFAASTSTATCTVTAIDNVAVDGNATATVAVAAPTVAGAYTVGSPSSATGTINDDDVAVNAVAGNTGSAASMGITEGAVARFSVSCPTLAAPFTVNYSIAPATPATGDVFVGGGATGSVTCPAAAASLVAVPTTVQTLDDSLIGNARTYTMTISVPAVPGPAPAATVIGNAVATVVVADNDQPTSIPTMGAAGLGLLSLMLAGLAAFQRRRRA